MQMNEREQKQKKFERVAVVNYLNFIGVDPTLLKSGERPDFSFTYLDKRIYLEHTLLINRGGQYEKSRTSSLKKFVADAKSLYDKNFPHRPVSLNLNFKYDVEIKKSNRDQLIDELICCILTFEPENKISEKLKFGKAPSIFDELEIILYPKNIEAPWLIDDIRLYGELKEDELTSRVNIKNKKALEAGWNQNYDEAWLLLHAGEKDAHYADYKIPEEWISKDWVFSKLIIYDRFRDNGEKMFQEIALNKK